MHGIWYPSNGDIWVVLHRWGSTILLDSLVISRTQNSGFLSSVDPLLFPIIRHTQEWLGPGSVVSRTTKIIISFSGIILVNSLSDHSDTCDGLREGDSSCGKHSMCGNCYETIVFWQVIPQSSALMSDTATAARQKAPLVVIQLSYPEGHLFIYEQKATLDSQLPDRS